MRCLINWSVAVTLFLACPSTCPGALIYPNDLAKWVQTEPPEPWWMIDGILGIDDDRYWSWMADDEYIWVVYLNRGRPSARLRSTDDPLPPPLPFRIEPNRQAGTVGKRLNVKVEDGWLVSFNMGEFGGHVWWYSPDGTRRYEVSSHGNINGFVLTGAGLLALEGISHGRSTGRVLRFFRDGDGRWRFRTFVPLGEEPRAAATDVDGSLVVITVGRLLRVNLTDRRVEPMITDALWRPFHPTSLLLSGGRIFIGMKHAVARVERKGKGYRTDWLLPVPSFDRMTRPRGGLLGTLDHFFPLRGVIPDDVRLTDRSMRSNRRWVTVESGSP